MENQENHEQPIVLTANDYARLQELERRLQRRKETNCAYYLKKNAEDHEYYILKNKKALEKKKTIVAAA